MYVDNDKHIESSKINYLSDRLSQVFYSKKDDLFVQFHLDTPQAPQTPEELIEKITKGDYTLPPKAERNRYDRPVGQIIWRSAD